MEINAFVIKICTETIAHHGLLQESGITQRINAFAQRQKQSGLDQLVNAQPDNLVIIVLHAQPQDTGMPPKINVYAEAY